ncbi:MAG: 4-alpha-glucanotransferase [Leptospirales bacterium]|nr:4-alpha-glucanotransferase [Leptospirales bacterium]
MPAHSLRYQTQLEALSFLTGLERCYVDFYGNVIQLETETCAALLAALGAPASSEQIAAQSIASLLEERLHPPAVVIWIEEDSSFTLRIPGLSRREWSSPKLELELIDSVGHTLSVAVEVQALPDQAWMWRRIESREPPALLQAAADDATAFLEAMRRLHPEATMMQLHGRLALQPDLYQARLQLNGETRQFRALAAPGRCRRPAGFQAPQNGLMAQLYALRSEANMGIGDFTDAAELAALSAAQGLRALMISPVHALFPGNPAARSPYSPSSRLFLNILHLRPEELVEWDLEESARQWRGSPGMQAWLQREKQSVEIDYPAVAEKKMELLRRLHECFRSSPASAVVERRQSFEQYRKASHGSLQRQATYDALYAYFARDRRYGFRQWPAAYQRPDAEAVGAFSAQYAAEIELYEYLHWNASLQFESCARRCSEQGSALIADLAVGVEPGGADVWSNPDWFIDGVHIGAPPDPFAAEGQNWGLAPLSPLALRRQCWQPALALFQNNMPHRGFARIDHVMGLARLYCTPAGESARAGAYVRYDFEAMLAALSLACERREGGAIGEDLGNAPDWLRARLVQAGVYSWKVYFFERAADGDFASTQDYAPRSVATLNTHDLATLTGWWTGDDLDDRLRRGLLSPDQHEEERLQRSDERERLLRSLEREGLLDEERRARLEDCDPHTLLQLGLALLARSSSELRLISLHDLLCEALQPNLPGTVDQYPNWKMRYSSSAADALQTSETVLRLKEFSESREPSDE